jgi:hypothetical protein
MAAKATTEIGASMRTVCSARPCLSCASRVDRGAPAAREGEIRARSSSIEMAGSDADFHRRDLFEAIARGDHPS